MKKRQKKNLKDLHLKSLYKYKKQNHHHHLKAYLVELIGEKQYCKEKKNLNSKTKEL